MYKIYQELGKQQFQSSQNYAAVSLTHHNDEIMLSHLVNTMNKCEKAKREIEFLLFIHALQINQRKIALNRYTID